MSNKTHSGASPKEGSTAKGSQLSNTRAYYIPQHVRVHMQMHIRKALEMGTPSDHLIRINRLGRIEYYCLGEGVPMGER